MEWRGKMNPYIQYMYSYPHKTAYGPLKGIHLKDYADRLSESENSLYFHIPFCKSKCGYCNLFSVAGQDETFMEKYVDAMERQAAQFAEILPKDAKYADLTLGGGTPLLLSEKQLERIFLIAEMQMGFNGENSHIIVETSPGQTTKEKLCILKEHHVTRVSMGVQSFQEEELKIINRSHSAGQAERAIEWIRQVGFACLNLDLIYGIPGQTRESLVQSVDRALEWEPEELFIYPLYIKEDTYLFQKAVKKPGNMYEMYLYIREYLKEKGYTPYSMRRFVRNGNTASLGSCGFGNTVSIGCGGRSYIGNLHFCTPYGVKQSDCMGILQKYMGQQDFLAIRHGYLLSEEEQRRRYVIKNILFGGGLSEDEYRDVYLGDVMADFPVLQEWIRGNYAYGNHGKVMLTEKGFSLSDYLGPMLISKEVREKMTQYYGRGSEENQADLLPGKS